MEPSEFDLKSTLEALVFAADEPISVKQLEEILNEPTANGEPARVAGDEIRRTIATLNEEYEKHQRAYRILQVGGGYQFATRPEFAEWIGKLYKEKGKRKLSHFALETLAIIAYRQPVTKPEIESIRGVNADYVLRTLLERRLVTITGRGSSVGRPLLYGTTKEFLKHFGINDLSDLPKPREIEEIMQDQNFETERQILDLDRKEEESEGMDRGASSIESPQERSQFEISPDGLLQPPNPDEPPQSTEDDEGKSLQ